MESYEEKASLEPPAKSWLVQGAVKFTIAVLMVIYEMQKGSGVRFCQTRCLSGQRVRV